MGFFFLFEFGFAAQSENEIGERSHNLTWLKDEIACLLQTANRDYFHTV